MQLRRKAVDRPGLAGQDFFTTLISGNEQREEPTWLKLMA